MAAQLLAERGLAGTFYVNSNRIDTDDGFLDWPQLSAMAGAGHEIGGHTADHVDLTQVAGDAARMQIAADRHALLARGHDACTFAYPYGSSNESVRSFVADAGYSAGRRAWGLAAAADDVSHPPAERLPPSDPLAVRTVPSFEHGTTLESLTEVVERGMRSHGWIPLVFHGVAAGEGRYDIPEAVFRAFVDWLAELEDRTEVRTVGAVVHAR